MVKRPHPPFNLRPLPEAPSRGTCASPARLPRLAARRANTNRGAARVSLKSLKVLARTTANLKVLPC